jgi:hypothetical protein
MSICFVDRYRIVDILEIGPQFVERGTRGASEVLGQKTVSVNWWGLAPAVHAAAAGSAAGGNVLELTNRHVQYKYLQSQCT